MVFLNIKIKQRTYRDLDLDRMVASSLKEISEVRVWRFFLLPVSILSNFYIAFVLQSNKSQLAMQADITSL